jgi:hypothetical protein
MKRLRAADGGPGFDRPEPSSDGLPRRVNRPAVYGWSTGSPRSRGRFSVLCNNVAYLTVKLVSCPQSLLTKSSLAAERPNVYSSMHRKHFPALRGRAVGFQTNEISRSAGAKQFFWGFRFYKYLVTPGRTPLTIYVTNRWNRRIADEPTFSVRSRDHVSNPNAGQI